MAAESWAADSVSTNQDGTVVVDWSRRNVTDEMLLDFSLTRLGSLLSSMPNMVMECILDMSYNLLVQPGPLAALLRTLRQAPLHITVLRLHNNRLVDSVAAVIAEHLTEAAKQDRPLMQLHLSSNAFTADGVQVLIESAHRCGAYPRRNDKRKLKSLGNLDNGRTALWLRTERQNPPVVDPSSVLTRCAERGYPVTIVPKGEIVPSKAVVQIHGSFAVDDGVIDIKGKGKGKGKDKTKDKSGKEQNYRDVPNSAWRPAGNAAGHANNDAPKRECWFFQRSTCNKGTSCPFAHVGSGTQNGKQDAPAEEEGKGEPMSVKSTMAWLEEKRKQPVFEAEWKSWCKVHQLADLPKGQRIESIMEFRAVCESKTIDTTNGVDNPTEGARKKEKRSAANWKNATNGPPPLPPPSDPVVLPPLPPPSDPVVRSPKVEKASAVVPTPKRILQPPKKMNSPGDVAMQSLLAAKAPAPEAVAKSRLEIAVSGGASTWLGVTVTDAKVGIESAKEFVEKKGLQNGNKINKIAYDRMAKLLGYKEVPQF